MMQTFHPASLDYFDEAVGRELALHLEHSVAAVGTLPQAEDVVFRIELNAQSARPVKILECQIRRL